MVLRIEDEDGSVRILIRAQSRDWHGRFSSGGGGGPSGPSGGGGGIVRTSLLEATTTDEVSSVLGDHLGATLGHSVSVDLRGMDTQLAREHAEGILQAAERFPNARLGRVETYGPGGAAPTHPGDPDGQSFAVTTGGRYSRNEDVISFNVRQSPEDYRASLRVSERAGYLVAGTPQGAAVHEFGHVLDHESTAGKMESLVAQRASQGGTTSRDLVRQDVSAYAAGSLRELLAEVVADNVINGSGASSLSKELFGEVEKDYEWSGARR